MVVVSVSLPKQLLDKFDSLLSEQGFSNRSEGIRDVLRAHVDERQLEAHSGENLAAIMILYDKSRQQAQLRAIQHRFPEIQTMLHTHLDKQNCIEILTIGGEGGRIMDMVKTLRRVPGVKRVGVFTTASDL